jgi:hypothetical protein
LRMMKSIACNRCLAEQAPKIWYDSRGEKVRRPAQRRTEIPRRRKHKNTFQGKKMR